MRIGKEYHNMFGHCSKSIVPSESQMCYNIHMFIHTQTPKFVCFSSRNILGEGEERERERERERGGGCLLVGCLTSQQHASVSQGRICTDNFTCCHTEIEAADQTFHLTQSQYTDTGPTSPSADPITPGAWQGIHWSANF